MTSAGIFKLFAERTRTMITVPKQRVININAAYGYRIKIVFDFLFSKDELIVFRCCCRLMID